MKFDKSGYLANSTVSISLPIELGATDLWGIGILPFSFDSLLIHWSVLPTTRWLTSHIKTWAGIPTSFC